MNIEVVGTDSTDHRVTLVVEINNTGPRAPAIAEVYKEDDNGAKQRVKDGNLLQGGAQLLQGCSWIRYW